MSVVLARPHTSFSGGMKAQPPSGGDGLAIGEQLTMEEHLNLRGGFTRVLRGTQPDPATGRQGVGVALTTDRGYIFLPANLAPDNVDFKEWCRENNVLLIHPFAQGEGGFRYDANSDTLIFDQDIEDEVRVT